WIVVRQLFGNQDRCHRQIGSFDILAADTQEVGVCYTMSLVDFSFVASLDEFCLRQKRRGSEAEDVDGVWLGRHQAYDLRGDAQVLRSISLDATDLDTVLFGLFVKGVEEAISIAGSNRNSAGG